MANDSSWDDISISKLRMDVRDDSSLGNLSISRLWFPGLKYKNRNKLNNGGFGTIYRADLSIKKPYGIETEEVAIKRVVSKGKSRGTKKPWDLKYKLDSTPSFWKWGRNNQTDKGVDKETITKEIQILHDLRENVFVVTLKEAIELKNSYWIVTELAKFGDLRQIAQMSNVLEEKSPFRKRYPIEIVRHLITPIFLATKYMHEKGIIHRDIKEDNILLTIGGIPKLCDFGAAEQFTCLPIEPSDKCVGTQKYIPPECLNGKPYDTTWDTWSLGITMLSMVYGGEPFQFEKYTHWYSANNEFSVVSFLKEEFNRMETKEKNSGQRKLYSLVCLDMDVLQPDVSDGARHKWNEFKNFVKKTLIYHIEDRPDVSTLCTDEYILPMSHAWKQLVSVANNRRLGEFECSRLYKEYIGTRSAEGKTCRALCEFNHSRQLVAEIGADMLSQTKH